ncbi:hypothetical protein H4R20_001470 [Coemansia guatemalensis]|uniref:6-phosphogluconate dehydrogenase C-terminal domain-like protein n=1 Tax=Coemansia guatemalensis TaxID=2761395 RepID=A0A9W8I3A0_9FUNG|nr:hypothetical protein H4R20_001470 [Coemansia guatemalensis]
MSLPKDAAAARIGWIGLGTLGQVMALKLQQHRAAASLSPLAVYNRTQSKCAAVEQAGANVAATVTEVALCSNVLFLSLFDDQSVKTVVGQIINFYTSANCTETAEPLLIADTTTVQPQTTEWVKEQIRHPALRRPIEFSQTPVWGAPPAARAAQLVLVTSSKHEQLLRSIAVPAIARTTIDCGDDPARAAKFKIMGNFMIASAIEALGEAYAVAHESGISRELYLKFVEEVLPAPPIVGYARKMAEEGGEASKSQVGFTVRGGLKDVGYAIDVAENVGMTLPIAQLARQHLEWVLDNGEADWDWSSLAFALRKPE